MLSLLLDGYWCLLRAHPEQEGSAGGHGAQAHHPEPHWRSARVTQGVCRGAWGLVGVGGLGGGAVGVGVRLGVGVGVGPASSFSTLMVTTCPADVIVTVGRSG